MEDVSQKKRNADRRHGKKKKIAFRYIRLSFLGPVDISVLNVRANDSVDETNEPSRIMIQSIFDLPLF